LEVKQRVIPTLGGRQTESRDRVLPLGSSILTPGKNLNFRFFFAGQYEIKAEATYVNNDTGEATIVAKREHPPFISYLPPLLVDINMTPDRTNPPITVGETVHLAPIMSDSVQPYFIFFVDDVWWEVDGFEIAHFHNKWLPLEERTIDPHFLTTLQLMCFRSGRTHHHPAC
jgi:hypothetical protein